MQMTKDRDTSLDCIWKFVYHLQTENKKLLSMLGMSNEKRSLVRKMEAEYKSTIKRLRDQIIELEKENRELKQLLKAKEPEGVIKWK
jgi:ATP-dependent protease HslVU (ClpYQ) peptidase subunit